MNDRAICRRTILMLCISDKHLAGALGQRGQTRKEGQGGDQLLKRVDIEPPVIPVGIAHARLRNAWLEHASLPMLGCGGICPCGCILPGSPMPSCGDICPCGCIMPGSGLRARPCLAAAAYAPAAASCQARPCLAAAASAPAAGGCITPNSSMPGCGGICPSGCIMPGSLCQAAVASAPADELCQALAAACVQRHMPLWPHHVGLAHARLWWPMLCSPTLQGPQALQGFFIPSSLMCPRGVGGSLAAATDDDRSRALFRDGMDHISTISSRNDMAVDSTLHSLPNPEVNPTQPRA